MTQSHPPIRRRKNIRLKGYDYSQPGEYFVTICAKNRVCVFGDIIDGVMRLSEIGKIVDAWWRGIPAHFEHVRVDVFQIMPNHLHGIVEIRDCNRAMVTQRPSIGTLPPRDAAVGDEKVDETSGDKEGDEMSSDKEGDVTSPLRNARLGNVIAYFKYQATKQINQMRSTPGKKVFQRGYYDHIIRSEVESFFIERYVELNPLLWFVDPDNLKACAMPEDELRRVLIERHGLDDNAIACLVDHELNYRSWHAKNQHDL
ncbi:MAG: hypothetical protein HY961_18940 [Ignavibacteriae bacterium]|nr:hypothetical protein [Ignavibacteriota bacterium]